MSCTNNCSSKASNCTITVSNIVNEPSSQSISAGRDKNFFIGGTITIPPNCGSGTFTGSASVHCGLNATLIIPMNSTCDPTLNISVVLQPQPITISVDSSQNLNFGQILSKSAHTVTVTPNGTCSSSDPAMILSSSNCSAGKFYIEKNDIDARSVSININANPLTNANGSGPLTLSNFALTLNGASVSPNSSISVTQSNSTLLVGASLNIPQDTNMGTYQGNYVVTISY